MAEQLAFSITEAANALSVSPWTIRKWVRDGRLKSTRLGRRVVVERAELLRVLAEGINPQSNRKRGSS